MKVVNDGTPAQRVERGSEGGKRECWQESQAEYGPVPTEETIGMPGRKRSPGS